MDVYRKAFSNAVLNLPAARIVVHIDYTHMGAPVKIFWEKLTYEYDSFLTHRESWEISPLVD